eukprot:Nk52_evm16s564 gene=Nk52_evmTU16s564
MAHSGNLFGGKEDPSSSSSSLTFIHPNVHPPARLVQFRAGRMHMEGSTVTADTQKGILYVYRSEDTLVHFCWDLRPDASRPATTDSAPVIDLIVFPGEAVFEPIPQRERVYLFRYKQNPDSKLFFWMQEPLATTPSNGKGTTTAAAAARFGEDELVHAMQEALEGNTNNSLLLHSNSNASITSQSMMDPADDTQLGRAMSIQERERMVQDMITGLAASSSSGNINTNSLMTMAASAWPGNAGASTIATAGNSGGTDASMQGVIEEEQGASTGGNSNDNNIKDNVDGMDVDYPPEKSNTNPVTLGGVRRSDTGPSGTNTASVDSGTIEMATPNASPSQIIALYEKVASFLVSCMWIQMKNIMEKLPTHRTRRGQTLMNFFLRWFGSAETKARLADERRAGEFIRSLEKVNTEIANDLKQLQKGEGLSDRLKKLIPEEIQDRFEKMVRGSESFSPEMIERYVEYMNKVVEARQKFLTKWRSIAPEDAQFYVKTLMSFIDQKEDDFRNFMREYAQDKNSEQVLQTIEEYINTVDPKLEELTKGLDADIKSAQLVPKFSLESSASDVNSLQDEIAVRASQSREDVIDELASRARAHSAPNEGLPGLGDNDGGIDDPNRDANRDGDRSGSQPSTSSDEIPGQESGSEGHRSEDDGLPRLGGDDNGSNARSGQVSQSDHGEHSGSNDGGNNGAPEGNGSPNNGGNDIPGPGNKPSSFEPGYHWDGWIPSGPEHGFPSRP